MPKFFESFEKYDFPLFGFIKIPKYNISDEEKKRYNLDKNCNSEDFLLALIKEGFENWIKTGKISKSQISEYKDRIDSEFNELKRLLFIDYILLVYKVIKFCKDNDILNGPARGSAGGSLILGLLDVVKIDALKHGLLFERFVSSARTEIKEFDGDVYISSGSLPDVDLDSMRSRKHEINEFLRKEFPNKTAAISNISTYQTKALIKEVYKCLEDASEEQARVVANFIDVKFGKVDSVEESLKDNEKFKKWATNHQETVQIASMLHESPKNSSIHASGIVICNEDIQDVLPLRLDKDGNELVSVYDMESVQYFGIKIDNLGLKNLDIIDEILKKTNTKLSDIDINHKSIYDLLNSVDCYHGIFQAEEGLGKQTLKKLKCENIEDIALSISVGRPGAMRFIDDIVKYKDAKTIRKVDPKIDSILENSYGIIVYQEQIMRLCRIMAKFTPLETNDIRKKIGKKSGKDFGIYKDKFIKQSIENGFNEEIVNDIWLSFENSGNYLFNKSHGIGYSYLTAICAYLKSNYPKEFFCASLNSAKDEANPIEEISKIQQELQFFNIKLLPPHILRSDLKFKIEGNDIRFSLSSIKGISDKTIEKLKNFRNLKSNKFEIFTAANECGIPVNIVANLINSGSMDDMLTESRGKTVLEAILWNFLTDKEKTKALELGNQYNFSLIDIVKDLSSKIKSNNGKNFFIKESRLETLRKKFNPYNELYKFNTKNPELLVYHGEKELIGFSYTTSLYKIFSKVCDDLIEIISANNCLDGDRVKIVGEVMEATLGKSREKQTPYLALTISDHSGIIRVMIFDTKNNSLIQECEENNGRLPKEGDIVIVRGRKRDGNCIFAESIGIQDCEVLDKISELKKKNEKLS
jgi:DNA polymerase-3 subunit alpha